MQRSLFLAILFSVILFTPGVSYALDPIVTCGFGGVMCTACDFFGLISNAMKWLVTIITLVITLVVVWAGIRIATSAGNASTVSEAKHMFTNAIIGFVILLCAWLIIDTVMKMTRFGEGSDFGPWNTIDANACKAPTVTGGATTTPTSTPPVTGTGANCPAAEPSAVIAIPSQYVKGDAEKALPATVQNFLAMREAASKDGIDLRVTDGWRPESEQVALWNQNCSSGVCGATKVAKPCSLGGGGSNHNSGAALDIDVGCANGSSGCNTKTYNWLKKNGAQWGFRNALPTDPLHWSPSGR
jgi:hypothetical protein